MYKIYEELDSKLNFYKNILNYNKLNPYPLLETNKIHPSSLEINLYSLDLNNFNSFYKNL